MSGRRSRQKGKVGERELAELFNKHGWPARRGQQFAGGSESADVRLLCPLPIHVECKRAERVNWRAAMRQAEGDTGPMNEPVVFERRNGEDWYCHLSAESLFRLIKWAGDIAGG